MLESNALATIIVACTARGYDYTAVGQVAPGRTGCAYTVTTTIIRGAIGWNENTSVGQWTSYVSWLQ